MKKKPFIITVLFFVAVAAYFSFSAKEEARPVPAVTTTSFPDLTQVTKLSSGTNPTHGQPGHRCDIAVGAPLPSGGTPSAVPQPSFSQATSSPSQTRVLVSSAGSEAKDTLLNINPPHGQPGHRCDVKTGDPLPPSGTKQAAPPKQNVTTVPDPVSAGSKLNPAHGEPSHRCDIQVGAPLPG